MESEEAVQIKDLLLGNIDARSHHVVVKFSVGNDDVEAVSRPALKDDDQAPGAGARFNRTKGGSCKKRGNCGGADHGHRAALHECSSCDAHHCLKILRHHLR
jgi:hypothetical protein